MKQKTSEHQNQQQAHGEHAMQRNEQQGENEQHSPQQQQSSPSMDKMKLKWKEHLGAAKVTWGKLTNDELLQSEGHAERLGALVQERYALSKEIADKQVKKFISAHPF